MTKALKKFFPVFAGPTLLAFMIAFIVPFFMGLYLSFTKFSTLTNARFVGTDNYARALGERSDFPQALLFTAVVSIISIITVNLGAFALAYFLTRKLRGTNFFRAVFFMPNLIGGIVLGYTWQVMLNALLQRWGQTIVNDWRLGLAGLVMLVNWQLMGYMMVIYIAGLQNVPPELIEASQIDGASRWQTLRNVTLPMIMPSITICLFLTLANTFKMYDQNLALTNGAPAKQTQMAALSIVNTMYKKIGQEGVAQAEAVIFFLIVAAIALIQLSATRSKEVDACAPPSRLSPPLPPPLPVRRSLRRQRGRRHSWGYWPSWPSCGSFRWPSSSSTPSRASSTSPTAPSLCRRRRPSPAWTTTPPAWPCRASPAPWAGRCSSPWAPSSSSCSSRR